MFKSKFKLLSFYLIAPPQNAEDAGTVLEIHSVATQWNHRVASLSLSVHTNILGIWTSFSINKDIIVSHKETKDKVQ